jgi:5'-nucleotidase
VIKLKWDAVFFDLDNTLYDYEKTFELTNCYVFDELKQENGWQVNTEIWFRHFKRYCDSLWNNYEQKRMSKSEYKRKRFIASLGDFGITAPVSTADNLQDLFNKKVAHFVVPFKGLHELLRFLSHQNVLIGIISNGDTGVQFSKIESLQISHWVTKEHIFISESCGYEKPDPFFFKWVNMHLEYRNNPLYIGDSWDMDIVPAIAAGWDTILLGEKKNQHKGKHPVFTSPSLEKLLEQFVINKR